MFIPESRVRIRFGTVEPQQYVQPIPTLICNFNFRAMLQAEGIKMHLSDSL